MKIARLRKVGVYILAADKGSAAISIKNVATGEFRQYRSGRRLEENMAALAELLESGISLTEAIERLESILKLDAVTSGVVSLPGKGLRARFRH